MKFRRKTTHTVEATQWFRNGDHPLDDVAPAEPREGKIVRYYNNPAVPRTHVCLLCAHLMQVHGFLDNKDGGFPVCPGDWIITNEYGFTYVLGPKVFNLFYEPVPIPDPYDYAGSTNNDTKVP